MQQYWQSEKKRNRGRIELCLILFEGVFMKPEFTHTYGKKHELTEVVQVKYSWKLGFSLLNYYSKITKYVFTATFRESKLFHYFIYLCLYFIIWFWFDLFLLSYGLYSGLSLTNYSYFECASQTYFTFLFRLKRLCSV